MTQQNHKCVDLSPIISNYQSSSSDLKVRRIFLTRIMLLNNFAEKFMFDLLLFQNTYKIDRDSSCSSFLELSDKIDDAISRAACQSVRAMHLSISVCQSAQSVIPIAQLIALMSSILSLPYPICSFRPALAPLIHSFISFLPHFSAN